MVFGRKGGENKKPVVEEGKEPFGGSKTVGEGILGSVADRLVDNSEQAYPGDAMGDTASEAPTIGEAKAEVGAALGDLMRADGNLPGGFNNPASTTAVVREDDGREHVIGWSGVTTYEPRK